MGMTKQLVILVEFKVPKANLPRFLEMVHENARRSLEIEPGCRRFDVALEQGAPDPVVLLYEIYDDQAAFQAHLALDHVKQFLGAAKALHSGQTIRRFDLPAAA
jgi:quinol monooxygenase YgiN